MIKVLSFLSDENCFAGHSRGPCGPRFEHHWYTASCLTKEMTVTFRNMWNGKDTTTHRTPTDFCITSPWCNCLSVPSLLFRKKNWWLDEEKFTYPVALNVCSPYIATSFPNVSIQQERALNNIYNNCDNTQLGFESFYQSRLLYRQVIACRNERMLDITDTQPESKFCHQFLYYNTSQFDRSYLNSTATS